MSRSYRARRRAPTSKMYGGEVGESVAVEDPDQFDTTSNQVTNTTVQYVYDGLAAGTMALDYSPEYPITPETYRPMAASHPVGTLLMPDDRDVHDDIDWTVEGQMGENDSTYSLGVVSSDAVENFSLDGRQAIIRRGRNPSAQGPVGTSDHNTLLGLAYAQSVNQYFPNEESQADLIQGV